ncbi:MAG: hypothetical protein ACMXYG_04465 [Candidatus Woesearchaeota archaeon]
MLDDKLRILYIGFGESGQFMLHGSIDALNNSTIRGKPLPAELYIVHSNRQNSEDILNGFLQCQPNQNISCKILSADKLEFLLDDINEFDQISISVRGSNDNDLQPIIKECLLDSGFDISPESLDYRFYEELPFNIPRIKELAELFKRHEVKGLVDIFTNQPDVLAYLWASITGNVRTVMGNNHLDTQRTKWIWSNDYKRILDNMFDDVNLPPLDVICAGYHGAGCVPILHGGKVNGIPLSMFKDMDKLYDGLKDSVIRYSINSKRSRINIRKDVINSYFDLLEALLQGEKTLGMSVFQRISDNPLFSDLPGIKEKEDNGTFIGYPVKIKGSPGNYYWKAVNPSKMYDKERMDFVKNYFKLHNLINSLFSNGVIPELISPTNLNDIPKHDQYFLLQNPITIEQRFMSADVRRVVSHTEYTAGIIITGNREKVIHSKQSSDVVANILYIPNSSPLTIHKVSLPDFDLSSKKTFKIGINDEKYDKRLEPNDFVVHDGKLYVTATYERKDRKESFLVSYDFNEQKEYSYPLSVDELLVKGVKCIPLYFPETTSRNMIAHDGRLYIVLTESDEFSALEYDIESHQMSLIKSPIGDKILTVTGLKNEIIFGGCNYIYRKNGDKLKPIVESKANVMQLRSLPDDRVVLYSDKDSSSVYAVSLDDPMHQHLLSKKPNFEITHNGSIKFATLDDDMINLVSYNGIHSLLNETIKVSRQSIEMPNLEKMVMGKEVVFGVIFRVPNTHVVAMDYNRMSSPLGEFVIPKAYYTRVDVV